jgi:hypothetical protein
MSDHILSSIITEPILTKQERKRMKKNAYNKRKKEREMKLASSTSQEPVVDPSVPPTPEELEAIRVKKEAYDHLQRWEEMAGLVGDFIKEYSRLPKMRSTHKIEKILGRWVFVQRTKHTNGTLHSYHDTRLKEIGVKF